MPRTVFVERIDANDFQVWNPEPYYAERLFRGNQEQVHSWLGQHDYKAVNLWTDISGHYRREGLGVAS